MYLLKNTSIENIHQERLNEFHEIYILENWYGKPMQRFSSSIYKDAIIWLEILI